MECHSTELDNSLGELAPADPAGYAEWLFSLAQGVGDSLRDIEYSDTVAIAQRLATLPAGSAPENDRVNALLVLHDSAVYEGDTEEVDRKVTESTRYVLEAFFARYSIDP